MSKPINDHFALKKVCRSVGAGFIGTFMQVMIRNRERWSDPTTKRVFIEDFYRDYYLCTGDFEILRMKINGMIRIVESNRIKDALMLTWRANDIKLDDPEGKLNAGLFLTEFCLDELSLDELCDLAELWFLGSFLLELYDKLAEWEDPNLQEELIDYFYQNYNSDDEIERLLIRIRSAMEIVKRNQCKEILRTVLQTKINDLGCDESKHNARFCLEEIVNEENTNNIQTNGVTDEN